MIVCHYEEVWGDDIPYHKRVKTVDKVASNLVRDMKQEDEARA